MVDFTMSQGRANGLRGGVSLLAMALVGMAAPAWAQEAAAPSQTLQSSAPSIASGAAATEDTGQEVVVVGVRAALATAQSLKKNADTFVDSITATDIGAFPDKSAAESLQRIPGITVNRLQSADDSTHPSGEPTGVLVRGLPQVRTEFNGRDSFSADSARGLQFNDVSPELLAGVDAYKNQTADMIEGGLAGTVNLRTRLPFDQKGLLVTGNFRYNYGDRSTRWTPEFSALVSDTFDTEIGRFGFLADYAQSHVVTRTESVIEDKIDTYCSSGFGTAANAIVNADGSIPCTSNVFGGTGWAFAPDGIRYSQVDYDRKRHGLALAGQYESPGGKFRATVQYLDSKYRNAWFERASHAIMDGTYFGTAAFNPRSSSILGPAPGSSLTFGADGELESGILTQPHGSFSGTYESVQAAINAGSAVPGVPFVNYCGNGVCGDNPRDGLYFQNEARNFAHREGTKDLSANIKWDATDRLHLNLDGQYIKAHTYNNDILVATGSMANYQYSLGKDGTPQVTLLPGSNVNYAAGALANPHNYWIPFIQGHVEDNDAHEYAIRGDADYDLDKGGWLDSLKVGVRYADRSQTVRYSTFNWTSIAAPWNCNGPGFNLDNTSGGAYPTDTGNCGGNAGHPNFTGYGAGIWESYDLGSNFYGKGVYPNGDLVYLNRDTLKDYDKLIQSLGKTTNSPLLPGYTAICDRPEATEGCFTPGEIMHVREKTEAAYAMLRFGGPDREIFGGINVQGNIGVRFVRTTEIASGSVAFPAADTFNNLAPCGTPLSGNNVVNPSCYLTPAVAAFANGASTPNSYKVSHNNWLPSFNVRFGLDQRDFIRFAYSRAISRPDFGYLRNNVAVNPPIINTGPDSPYVVYNSPSAAHTAANVTGYNFVFLGNAGNAALKPMWADQFDVAFERYVGRNSSFALGAFYKKLHDTFGYGQFNRDFTNGSSTGTVQIRGPMNFKDGGTLSGVEASFQTFFDFLPGLLSGLGAQANYTYVHQHGINNSNLSNAVSGSDVGAVGIGQPSLAGTGSVIDSHKLQGVSTHTFNIVGLYEKGPVGLRVAYNWRSRYLTDNLDCCIGLPVFQKSAGFLDASVRFSPTKWLELSVDASNLLNTKTVYQQEVFGDSPQTPGAKPVFMDSAWNRVDRRYQFGARVKF